MSKLRKEIHETGMEIIKDNNPPAAAEKLQRLSDSLIDQIGGGWVDVQAGWSKRF